MDKRLYEQLNLCARLLQEEECAVTYASKKRARLDYEKEYSELLKIKEKIAV